MGESPNSSEIPFHEPTGIQDATDRGTTTGGRIARSRASANRSGPVNTGSAAAIALEGGEVVVVVSRQAPPGSG